MPALLRDLPKAPSLVSLRVLRRREFGPGCPNVPSQGRTGRRLDHLANLLAVVPYPGIQSAQDRHPRQDSSPRTRRRLCLPCQSNGNPLALGWTSTTVLEATLHWTLAPLGSGFGACVAQAPAPATTQTTGASPSLPIQTSSMDCKTTPAPASVPPGQQSPVIIANFRQAPPGSLLPALKAVPGSFRLPRFLREVFCSASVFPSLFFSTP